MTPDEHADILRDAVRAHVPGGGEQHLDALLAMAGIADKVRTEVTIARGQFRGGFPPGAVLQDLMDHLDELTGPEPERRATVILFKPSGKYYAEEQWRVPVSIEDESPARGKFQREALGPWDMQHSPDFHRIEGCSVLVPEQEPWGYPHLFPGER